MILHKVLKINLFFMSLYTFEFCSVVPWVTLPSPFLSVIYSHTYQAVLAWKTYVTCHIHVQHYAAFVVACSTVNTER